MADEKKKYVPPHMRNRNSSAAPDASDSGSNGNNRGFGRPGGNARRWADDTPNSKLPATDIRSLNGSRPPIPVRNTRWNLGDVRKKPTMARNERLEKELFGEQKTGINFEKYDDIPVEISHNDVAPLDSYTNSTLHEILKSNIELAGYTMPTPVQKNAVPYAMAERDCMGCAQTGSGKTAAFLFPLINKLLNSELAPTTIFDSHHRRTVVPYGLILAPTRELAMQIYQEARKFTYRTGLRAVVVYGGADSRNQVREMEKGVDILVATPGRLDDFIGQHRISLANTKYLVLDEADRMLDMGFEPQIRKIVEEADMPSKDNRQTLMFSATFPKEIQKLAQDFLNDYVFLAIGRVGSTTDFITQKVEYAQENDKKDKLMAILPKCEGLTLIFVETKRAADSLDWWLREEGINAISIHGGRTQEEREYALSMFKCGRCPVLVATDVAARGLDIPNVLHVINYDMPNNIDDYVHRIGRTGRCGNVGTAIGFVNERNKAVFKDLFEILKENNQEVPDWFEEMIRYSMPSFGNNRGARRGGRGSKFRYGTRDYRDNYDNNSKDNRGKNFNGHRNSSNSQHGRSQGNNKFGSSQGDAW